MSREIWKPIPNWPKYMVSNSGRVKRLPGFDAQNRYRVEGGYIKPVPVQSGSSKKYKPLTVSLSNGGRAQSFKVAYLVLLAFKGPSNGRHVCHKNDDQENNRLDNLRWGNNAINVKDRIKNGRTPRGIKNVNAKLTDEKIREIRILYRYGSEKRGTVALAKKYKVNFNTIWQIVNGKTWRHVV